MSHAMTLARPYAKALFNAVCEEGLDLAVCRTDLEQLSIQLTQACVSHLLKRPGLSVDDRLAICTALMPNLSSPLLGLLRVLIEKRKTPVLPELYELFSSYCDTQSKQLSVTLYTAFPVDDDFLKTLKAHLSKSNSTADSTVTVSIESVIDQKLLGGGVLRMGDQVIDASLRTQLNRLTQTLTTS